MSQEIIHKINDPRGMHARPAGQFVTLLSSFESKVQMSVAGGNAIDGKRLLLVMKLAASQGDDLKLVFDGPDEEKAAKDTAEFLKANM